MTLREARKKAGLSMQELGKLVGVSAVAIWRYEHGTRSPKIQTAKRIAEILGIAWYDLIDNKGLLSDESKPA